MDLYHPDRPLLPNSHPAWLSGFTAVKPLEIWPLPNGEVEVRAWLPLDNEPFASCQFGFRASPDQLPQFISDFRQNPELFCQTHFKNHFIKYNLTTRKRLVFSEDAEPQAPKSKTRTLTLNPSEMDF